MAQPTESSSRFSQLNTEQQRAVDWAVSRQISRMQWDLEDGKLGPDQRPLGTALFRANQETVALSAQLIHLKNQERQRESGMAASSGLMPTLREIGIARVTPEQAQLVANYVTSERERLASSADQLVVERGQMINANLAEELRRHPEAQRGQKQQEFLENVEHGSRNTSLQMSIYANMPNLPSNIGDCSPKGAHIEEALPVIAACATAEPQRAR